ncbi:hypothetical protein HBI16_006990 [Parastagonospora nodorum]|nr:hypothetical protein HBI16_006990 [Parastagonospora nodorum]
MILAKVRQYSAKVKTEDLSNTLTLILSKTAQQQSSSVMSNRSTALITDKFSVASLTKPAILNNANVALVDAMHHSVIDALTMTLIKNNDDLLGTINSHIKPPLKRSTSRAHAGETEQQPALNQLKESNSDDYRSDSSSDINPKDNLEDEEATTAKDLTREQKERLKALLNAKTRDGLSARVRTAIEHCTLEEIFANAIGIGKTQAIVLAVLIEHVHFKN